jgi:hypothetical protein
MSCDRSPHVLEPHGQVLGVGHLLERAGQERVDVTRQELRLGLRAGAWCVAAQVRAVDGCRGGGYGGCAPWSPAAARSARAITPHDREPSAVLTRAGHRGSRPRTRSHAQTSPAPSARPDWNRTGGGRKERRPVPPGRRRPRNSSTGWASVGLGREVRAKMLHPPRSQSRAPAALVGHGRR